MEWLLLALAGAGGLFGASRFRARRARQVQREADLSVVRHMADADVTVFGEQLRRLDAEVAGRELDEVSRSDYQVALDAYETAAFAVPRMHDPDEVASVADTLASGRYALTCVQARLAGRELPERRVPCFFNPQHGPSVRDVSWDPGRGRGTRIVPACAQDAARVAAHEQPEVRTVQVGYRTVPYWEAGALVPYGSGYFAGGAALGAGASVAWAFVPLAASDHMGGVDPGAGGYDVGGFGAGGDVGGGFDVGGGSL